MSGRVAGASARREAGILSLLVASAVVALAGCATAPATPITADDVVAERIATLESVEREQFDAFLEQSGGRLDELGLPVPQFQGLVGLDDIDAIVSQCIVTLNPRLQVARDSGGFTVTYFGTVGETYDRIRWTIDSCNAQYGVADLRAATTPGAVEAAWRYQDATLRVLPCLRSIGVAVPTPPDPDDFASRLGTPLEFSPFSLAAADPATLVRSVALCPPSSTLLEAHLATLDPTLSPSEPEPEPER